MSTQLVASIPENPQEVHITEREGSAQEDFGRPHIDNTIRASAKFLGTFSADAHSVWSLVVTGHANRNDMKARLLVSSNISSRYSSKLCISTFESSSS